jgi:hypothetical protein
MIIVSNSVANTFEEHKRLKDLNHNVLCFYEDCGNREHLFNQLDKAYLAAKTKCAENLPCWQTIPIEDQAQIALLDLEKRFI